jgi:hypothetical protein
MSVDAPNSEAVAEKPQTIDEEAKDIGADPEFVKALEKVGIDAGAQVKEVPLAVEGESGAASSAMEGGTGSGVEEGGKEAASPASWINDEARGLARSYGLSERELAEFASEAEFRRASRLIDKQISAAAAVKPETEESGEPPIELDPETYKAAGYDEETVRLVTVARQLQERLGQLEPVIGQFQQMQAYAAQQSFANSVHATLDTMDEGLFGRTVKDGQETKISAEADENRRKLWEAAGVIENGIIATAAAKGQPPEVPPLPLLLKRAEQMVFGDKLVQREREALTKKVQQQSQQRRPSSGGQRALPKADKAARKADLSIDEEASSIVNDPEFIKALSRIGA